MGEIGIPQVNFYSMLSGLGDTIQASAKQQQQQAFNADLQNARKADGSVDWDAVGNAAAKHNMDLPTTLSILKLGQDQRKQQQELDASNNFRSTLGGIFGGATTPGATPAAAAAPAAITAPRPAAPGAPVQPTAKVWGDKEAEDAGLYEKPAAATSSDFGTALSGKKPDMLASMRPQPVAVAAPAQPPQPAAPQPAADDPAETPAAKGFAGINAQHIPVLAASMANPRLPAGDRELAGTLLKRALDDAKPNEKMQYLTELKNSSNFQGTPLELEMQLRKAGKTDVTIDQRGETEEAKAAGKAAGERRGAMYAAANKASDGLGNLTTLQTLLNQVDQGKLAPSRMTVSAWAKAAGLNDDVAKSIGLDPSKAGSAQAIQSIVNEMTIGKIGPGGFPANNFSDADRQFISEILPKLSNEPKANQLILESMKRIYNSQIERAGSHQDWMSDPANKGKNFEAFEYDRARKTSQMDRFADLRKQAQTMLPADDAPAASPAPAPQAPQGRPNVSRQGVPWSIQ